MNEDFITLDIRRIKDQHDQKIRLNQLLSAAEVLRASQFKKINDAVAFRLARSLVRNYLSDLYGIKPKDVPIFISELGKPYCNLMGAPFFSIAHCSSLVIVGWSNKEIGVDVEQLDTQIEDKSDHIWLSDDEIYAIMKAESPRKERLRYFVAKESCLKLLGTGFLTEPKLLKINATKQPDFLEATSTDGPLRIQMRSLADRWLIGIARKNPENS